MTQTNIKQAVDFAKDVITAKENLKEVESGLTEEEYKAQSKNILYDECELNMYCYFKNIDFRTLMAVVELHMKEAQNAQKN